MPIQLLGRKDDLDALGVIGLRDWVVEEADGSDDFAGGLQLVIGAVGWVTDDDWSLGSLISAPDAFDLAISSNQNLINVGLQHVGASVNCAKS